MLTLSAKARYGLQAMYDLSLYRDGPPRQVREVAASQRIPQQFLEQVLVLLKRAGLVRSFRGSHGGYLLARAPESISVLQIVTALDGELGLAQGNFDAVLAARLRKAETAIAQCLDFTMADLVWDQQQASGQLSYEI